MTTIETDDAPAVDEQDPASLVPAAVDQVLRLAATWLAWDGAPRLGALSADELDRPRPEAWTLRQIAHHVVGVTYYAEQVGDLISQLL